MGYYDPSTTSTQFGSQFTISAQMPHPQSVDVGKWPETTLPAENASSASAETLHLGCQALPDSLRQQASSKRNGRRLPRAVLNWFLDFLVSSLAQRDAFIDRRNPTRKMAFHSVSPLMMYSSKELLMLCSDKFSLISRVQAMSCLYRRRS